MRDPDMPLDLRMYFFVPYNISPIQQSIQAGHAALEYAMDYGRLNPDHIIWDFIYSHKTWIILNGGTTNKNRGFDSVAKGTLDQIGDSLLFNNIDFSYFMEPDLNNALTAVCFIADERVWNYEDYPDFMNWFIENHMSFATAQEIVKLKMRPPEEYPVFVPYSEWVEFVGGKKNVFLRELIKGKKLA